MPYIEIPKRKKLDKVVKLMKELDVKANGDLNYILFKFCKVTVKDGYNNFKNYCGELRECAVEIERRLLGPYEDSKRNENGDIDGSLLS